MHVIADHNATILPFSDALLRTPKIRDVARRPPAGPRTPSCPTT